MTVDNVSITKEEVEIILAALNLKETTLKDVVTELSARVEADEGKEWKWTLINRDAAAKEINDIQRLGYYLRAKVDN